MSDVLGYAQVSTGDQDLTGRGQRLDAVGASRAFEDVRPGRSMDQPGLQELLKRWCIGLLSLGRAAIYREMALAGVTRVA